MRPLSRWQPVGQVVVVATEGDLLPVEGSIAMSEATDVSEFVEDGRKQVVFASSSRIGFGLVGAAS
jgi:hypothetical protein